ncbi:MAG: thiolase family protein [Elusimicrobia bacterium]|nr:thiolase family protein [Elusimicrobiota bacterium]
MPAREVVILGAVRSPMGKLGGALARVRPDDLAAHVIKALLERVFGSGFESAIRNPQSAISDVYFGCANQSGEDNRNIARMAALLAGLPYEVPGCTVNRLCASGLEAVNLAAKSILAGEGDLYIAGGVESMSRSPWVVAKSDQPFPYENMKAYDTTLGWRFPNPRMEKIFPLLQMGETAENVAEKYKISRKEQDEFALESHRRAVKVRDTVFKEEIVPIPLPQSKIQNPKSKIDAVNQDEPPRTDTNLEKLATLSPVFKKGGTVTAGNSSGLNDGAAALLLAESQKAKELGLKPIAKWVGSAVAGVDPCFMGIGPVPATQKLLKRLGLSIKDFDLIELNEAFAAQSLACIRELNIPREKLNVNGGAIALGHPLGCSGARILTTLIHEMRRRKSQRGLATLCVGVGQGVSTAVELT